MIEGRLLLLCKALIAAFGVGLFLLPLATPAGLVAGTAGTVAGYLAARLAARLGLRLPVALGAAGLLILAAHLGGQLILDGGVAGFPPTAIALSDVVFFGAGALGLFFGLRILSQRARVFSVLELATVVGAVAHTFADHRHQHIHQPRFFSDWAWSQGIDPSMVLEAAGVAAIALAVVLLLQTRSRLKLLLTLLALLLAGIGAFFLLREVHLGGKPDTNELGLTKDEQDDKNKNGGGSGGGGSSRKPDPVAVALLHDDLPDADIVYFRQAVLSRFLVDRLVEDTSGRFDRDVVNGFPGGRAAVAETTQAPGFHREVLTSMFLLVDHAQLFGLGHPIELRPLENPDPRRFVAAYDVRSRFLHQELGRLIGRPALPSSWSEEERSHYLAAPADPRYRELAERLVRDIDPRFVGDDLMSALVIKRYLEKEGFYTLKEKRLVGPDPTGRFLFGDLRGYCVHFAHSAALLFRTLGIPARVALGYAVQTARRGAGSSLLIFSNEAHAWPEIYLEGVGWVTFDIYPERSDEPPPPPNDQDLESILGELARKDRTGGKGAQPGEGLVIPWRELGLGAAGLAGAMLVASYLTKIVRRVRRGSPRLVYRAALDRLSDIGAGRRLGETRERHAARVATIAPSFAALTREHLRASLGGRDVDPATVARLARAARDEQRARTRFHVRLLGLLNPFGWLRTR